MVPVILALLTGATSAIWWGYSTHTKLRKLTNTVGKIEQDIARIFAILENRYVTTGRSPIILTQFGKSKDS